MTEAKHIDPIRPGIHIDELADTADPHAIYQTLRENYPVCQLEPNGYWAISRHKDVEFACKRPGLFSSEGVKALLQPDWMPEDCKRSLFVLTLDPPEHTPLRRKLDSAVGQQRVLRALAVAMKEHARKLVDKIEQCKKIDESEEVDFIAAFANPYIGTIINRVVGSKKKHTPPEELAEHPERTNKNISDTPTKQYIQDQIDGLRRSKSYFSTLIQERRTNPKDDLISQLLAAKFDGASLTDDDIWNAAELVNLAGTQGPIILLAHAMMRLARQPDLLHMLRKTPQLIPVFIEELLRHASPAPAVLRKTTAAVTLSGVTIPRDATVLLLYGAANRDPRIFPNPDAFDPTRENISRHLAFGHGPHFCTGAALTRLEVRIALEAITSKFSSISCPPDDKINWNNSWMANSMRDLPIKLS